MASVNGIVGDSLGIDLPQANIPEEDTREERAMAAFSKTNEFKRLKDHLELRIAYNRTLLPGTGENTKTNEQIGEDWRVADRVIAELQGVIDAYELANEVARGRGK